MRKINDIIIIDDDPITNFINHHLINNRKIAERIEICLNGKEALDFLIKLRKEHDPPPELILLDTKMPVMDGFDFLQAYEDLNLFQNNITKIVMLSVSTESDIQKIKSLGYKFVEKPLTIEKMYQILDYNFE